MLNHTLPSRYRNWGTLFPDSWYSQIAYRPVNPAWDGYKQPVPIRLDTPCQRVMFDEKAPLIAMKPCVSSSVRYVLTPRVWTNSDVSALKTPEWIWQHTWPGGYLWNDCPFVYRYTPGVDNRRFWWGKTYPHPEFGPILSPVDDHISLAMSYSEAQDAVNYVMNQFHRSMTTIRNDLPDMTVFVKELGDFKRCWGEIRKLAKSLAGLIENTYGVAYATKRGLAGTPAGQDVIKRAKKSKTEISDGIKSPYTYSDAFVSVNFGYLAPFRDICAIVSELSMKLRALVPDGNARTEHFSRGVTVGLYDNTPVHCRLNACAGQSPVCWDHPFGAVDKVSINFRANVTAEMRSRLTGFPIEKAIASVLGLVGALPNVESLWEMTRLSWLVDYFFRVDKVLRKTGLLKLSPVDTIVMQSCCSVKIERVHTRTFKMPCFIGAAIELHDTYYERALDYNPLESLCGYTSLPRDKEWGLAAAVLMQIFRGRPR